MELSSLKYWLRLYNSHERNAVNVLHSAKGYAWTYDRDSDISKISSLYGAIPTIISTRESISSSYPLHEAFLCIPEYIGMLTIQVQYIPELFLNLKCAI